MTTKVANIVLSIRRALIVGPVLLATSAFGQQRHADGSRVGQEAPVRSDTLRLVTGDDAQINAVVAGPTGSCCFALGTPGSGCIDGLTQAECDNQPSPRFFEAGRSCSDGCCDCVPSEPEVCNDGDACTIEWCNICRCERQPKFGFDPGTDCCHPITGAVATRIDADQCTTDTCSFGGSRGEPQHTLSPLGTPCDDWNVCTVNDACDGVRPAATGGCVVTDLYTAACEDALCPETNPNGVPCDDLNPCTMNDVCDPLGNCRGTPEVGCDTFARTPINCACDVPATRSIALFVPSSTPVSPTALRVNMIELQNPVPPNLPQNPRPDFSAYEAGATCTDPAGCVRWVGPTNTYLESQDTPGLGNFRGARLQCTPHYQDWTTEGVFYVTGAEIVPSSKYDVHAYGVSCNGVEGSCLDVSLPLRLTTARSGDVEAPFNPPSTTAQPNAIDITQVVNHFKRVSGAPVKAIVQLQPNLVELNADVSTLDIVAVVDAVKQSAYAFSGPCPCPSAVTCSPAMGSVACTTSTPCVTAFGAGALCVKTCTGGDYDGDPCINNTHCPGTPPGTCGSGFCRDACGRCSP